MARCEDRQSPSSWVSFAVAGLLAALLGAATLMLVGSGHAAATSVRVESVTEEGPCLASIVSGSGTVTYTALQDAIDAVGPGLTIKVAAGTCSETLSIQKSLRLQGGWSRDFSVRLADPALHSTVNALSAGRVVSVSKQAQSPTDVVVELDGLTLTGGDATGLGGGTGAVDIGGAVYAQGAELTIRNCIITDSVATSTSSRTGWGGGIGTYLCDSVLLESNTLANNVAGADGPGNGGAFADYRSRSVALQGNVIEGNVASVSDTGNGGGVWVSNVGATPQDRILLQGNAILRNAATGNGTGHGGGLFSAGVEGLLIEGDLYQGNEAAVKGTGYGGAVALDGGRVTLTAPWFAANVATTGGGLWASGGNLTLARAYALGNEARDGGAVWLGGVSGGRIENTVIAENVTHLQGACAGPCAGAGIVVSGGSVQLLHTTLALNSGGDGSGLLATGGASVWLTNTIAVSHTVAITAASGSSAVAAATLWGGDGWANGADLGGEATSVGPDVVGIPDFVAFAGRPYHIGRQSAALDAGIDAGVFEDIDGHVRPLGNGVDLGADEAVVIWLPLILRGDVVAGGD